MVQEDAHPDIIDFLEVAAAVTGEPLAVIERQTKIGLAESALAAPFASFDGEPFYTDPIERAAVLCSRIVRNHPLPDGNKRVAYLLMADLLERDGLDLDLDAEQQTGAEAIMALAARTITEVEFVDWLADRVQPIGGTEAAG